MSDVERIVSRLRAFTADRDWGQFHDPKNLAMLLASEAADVAIALLLFCDRAGIDVWPVVEVKIDRNAEKYPVESSSGHARTPRR